uniref:(northern house mosquito) hypothetical protein n=1 Tax=Culex pipiens TaxID=7175 RepID=A0A8D8J5U0_CULPI
MHLWNDVHLLDHVRWSGGRIVRIHDRFNRKLGNAVRGRRRIDDLRRRRLQRFDRDLRRARRISARTRWQFYYRPDWLSVQVDLQRLNLPAFLGKTHDSRFGRDVIVLLWRFLLLLSANTVLLNDGDNVVIGSFPVHKFVLHYRSTIVIIYNFITSLVLPGRRFQLNLLRFYLRWRRCRRDLDYLQIIIPLNLLRHLGLAIGHNHTGSVLPLMTSIPLHFPIILVLLLFLLRQQNHLLVLIVVVLLLLMIRNFLKDHRR